MPEKTWEPLREAVWKDMPGAGAEQLGGAELPRVLERAEDLGGEINGVAYTTSGAYSVRRVGASGLTTLIEKDGQVGSREEEIDLDTVFELRLWRVMDKKTDDGGNVAGEDGVLAHELRWLNGTGSAEVAVLRADGVGDGAATGAEDCWYRPNAYLQHSDSERDPRKMPAMESIEVFIIEDEYGNTVFVDELMTGEWKRNG